MIKIQSFYLLLIVTFSVIILPACKTHKSIAGKGGYEFKIKADPSDVESYFNELFYNGFKAMELENNDEKAANYFKQCLSINSKSDAVLYNLAIIYYRDKRLDEAEGLMEKTVALDNQNKWYLTFLGDIYVTGHAFNKAIAAYQKLIVIDPEDDEPYYKLASAYIYSRQPLKAIKELDKLESITGINRDLIDQKKKIYLSINKVDKAAEEVEKLMNSDPGEKDYIIMLIDLYLANNRENKIFPLYQKIIDIDSNDSRALLVLADYYLHKKDKAKGMELTYRAFKNPDYDVQDKITFIYYNFLFKKDTSAVNDVLKLAEILVNIHPDSPRAYAFRGDVLNDLGRKDEALKDYHKALQFEKSILLLWKKVIILEIDRRNYPEAASVAKEAIEYFPSDAELYFYLGIVYNQLKDYQSAISSLEKGIIWVIGNEALKGQYYSNLGEAYNSIKDFKNSDLNFEKALKIDTIDATTMNNYAYYLSLRKDRLDSAMIMSGKSIRLEPRNPAFLDTYGWIMYLKGNYKEAEQYISSALKIKPDDSDVLEHYGDVLYKLGKTDEAVLNWEKAFKLGGKSENLERKIKDRKLYE